MEASTGAGVVERDNVRPKKRAASDDHDCDEDDSEHDHEDDLRGGASPTSGGGEPLDDLSRLRREKRLAMNRESARVRRKRKKMLLETLEQQVADISKKNQSFQLANETLLAKVTQLEAELAIARSTIAVLSQSGGGQLGAADAAASSMINASTAAAAGSGGDTLLELTRQDNLRRMLSQQQQQQSQQQQHLLQQQQKQQVPLTAASQLDLQVLGSTRASQFQPTIMSAFRGAGGLHGLVDQRTTAVGDTTSSHYPPQLSNLPQHLAIPSATDGRIRPAGIGGLTLSSNHHHPLSGIDAGNPLSASMIEEILKRAGSQQHQQQQQQSHKMDSLAAAAKTDSKSKHKGL